MNNPVILRAESKAFQVLANSGRVSVSVSGGADSDCMLDLIVRTNDYLTSKGIGADLFFVFFDTGLEYQATKDHLFYLEKRYGINIFRYKAKKSIPFSCNNYGIPFLSKKVSDNLQRLQKHNFDFVYRPLDQQLILYPHCRSALRWLYDDFPSSTCNSSQFRGLRDFLFACPPDFPISSICCDWAKKRVAHQFEKDYDIDISCVGVRKAEGGQRALAYKSCFDYDSLGVSSFRPLFWFSDSDRLEYEKQYGIVHSACYSEYGLKRTGCAGCPFGRNCQAELSIIQRFEPRLYNACLNLFGRSYTYRELYYSFRSKK